MTAPARAAALAAGLALVGCLVAPPAQATVTEVVSQVVSPASPPPTHPELDRMGSTIRANEAAAGRAPSTSTGPTSATPQATTPTGGSLNVLGNDVSSYQPSVDWTSVAAQGAGFAYVKASEGVTYTSPTFASQYSGSASAGLLRGAYHFALPDQSSGSAQATYFVQHGGGWSADGRTLPPMLDIEYNPYTTQTGLDTCYGLTPGQMTAWIADFSATVRTSTGRYPLIYTTTAWWNTCTGSSTAFGRTNPLFLARYAATPGTMPAGWTSQALWQYADSGAFPGDQDQYNGTSTQLRDFAIQPAVPVPVHAGPVLSSGQALYPPPSGITDPADRLLSPNQQYQLYQQSDGNLVEYGNGTAPFNARTSAPGSRTEMQADGNLVTYGPTGTPLFNTGTSGNPGAFATLQDDGNLVVYSADGSRPLWAAYGRTDTLRWSGGPAGAGTLTAFDDGVTADRIAGQYLASPAGTQIALVAGTQLFVGGRSTGATFATPAGPATGPLTRLVMQVDGNLVIYVSGRDGAAPSVAAWSTRTDGNTGAHAQVQDDGNLVVYSAAGRALWSSKFGRTY